jgi:hypothetical protein
VSVDATRWAWSQSLKASEKLVLLALADRAGENHGCWPSVSRLVSDTGLDKKTISAVTQRLEDCGLLVISRESGKGNFYQLIGVEGRHDDKASKTAPDPKTVPVPKTGLPRPKNGSTPDPKTGHESKKNLTRTEKRERGNAREGFAVFWQAYPRKVSKAQAENAWAKIAPDECLLRVIVAAVEGSKTSEQWQRDNGQFIPHPATWLNGRRWEDEQPAPITPTAGASARNGDIYPLQGQFGRSVSPQARGNFTAKTAKTIAAGLDWLNEG